MTCTKPSRASWLRRRPKPRQRPNLSRRLPPRRGGAAVADTEILGDNVRFPKTSWDLVRAATEPKGMDQLIRLYWKPLYYFVRQKGFDNETSKDMVQGFLADALERGTIAKADPSRGKFGRSCWPRCRIS